MTKRFFLAALTAIALTMGFTACSDDDDAGKYEMNVFLRLDHLSSDEAESKQIVETYITALGITNQEEMIVTIQGKDSLDCVNTVTEKCAKAEAQLDGQQWSDMTSISVYIDAEKNSKQLYSKTFGKTASNAAPKYYFFGEDVKKRGGHTATNMCVQVQSNDFGTKGWRWDYPYLCDTDLNLDAGGKYVYAMFDTEGITSLQEIQKLIHYNRYGRELNKYIADVLVLVSDNALTDFHEFTYEGANYKYAQGIYGDPVMWDLNKGAGGPYLYLFYSTDATRFQRVIDIDECVIARDGGVFTHHNFDISRMDRGPWEISEFVHAVKYDNGDVVFQNADADFNQDAGGHFIHMRADYISFDHIEWLKFDENGNAIKD